MGKKLDLSKPIYELVTQYPELKDMMVELDCKSCNAEFCRQTDNHSERRKDTQNLHDESSHQTDGQWI